MDIYRINTNLPRQDQIDDLNEMVLELEGGYEQGKFDINEIEQLIADLGIDRQFLRNQGIGNTIGSYSNWTHLKAETGFSIWKYTPTNYNYNALNKLYFDNKVLENRGEANAESATIFDKVFNYDAESGGGTYNDDTAEAGTETGTEFELMNSSDDYLYVGIGSTFTGIKFEFHTRGSDYTLKVEYYDTSLGWTQLTVNDNNLEDATSNFESDGRINWDLPATWGQTAVNGITKYWIRISTTVVPVTTAKAYYIIPATSVVGLLALSSSEYLDEDWAWCSYSDSIYVTIRNDGESSYEGNYYITSTSSSANKANFFVHNHEYTADYEDDTYVSGGGAGRKYVLKTTANINYYVSPTGDDSNDGLSAGSPFATIQYAIDQIPEYLDIPPGYGIKITLADGIYNEGGIDLANITGGGWIVIEGSGDPGDVIIQGSADDYYIFNIRSCNVSVSLWNITFKVAKNNASCIYVGTSEMVDFWSCDFGDGGQTGTIGVNASWGGHVHLNDCNDADANKVATGIYIRYGTRLSIGDDSTSVFGDTYLSMTYGAFMVGSNAIYNDGAINLIPNQDLDDYFQFKTVSGIPQIGTIGDCDIKIIPSNNLILAPIGGDTKIESSLALPITIVTADSGLTINDHTILVDGDPMPSGQNEITLTLPSASEMEGRVYVIKIIDLESGSNGVIIDTQSGETIDGQPTKTLQYQNEFVKVQSDGNNWWIIADKSTV